MRLPLFIVLPLIILVTILTWIIGTRSYDFLTPPSDEQLYALKQSLVAEEEAFQSVAELPKTEEVPEIPETPQVFDKPEPAPQFRLDLGPVQITPGLSEYTAAASQGAEYMMNLAKALEEQGYTERALLALERLLDSTAAPPGVHREAAENIRRLLPEVPLWTVDPSEVRQITLKAGTTLADPAPLQAAMEEVASLLTRSSSGILSVTPELSISPPPSGDRILPIAMWLGLPGEEVSTTILTFTLDELSPEIIRQKVLETSYSLIQDELAATGLFRPLANLPRDADITEALRFKITRLEWRELAESLMRRIETAKQEGT